MRRGVPARSPLVWARRCGIRSRWPARSGRSRRIGVSGTCRGGGGRRRPVVTWCYESWLERHHIMEFDRSPRGDRDQRATVRAVVDRGSARASGTSRTCSCGSPMVGERWSIADRWTGPMRTSTGSPRSATAVCDEVGWEYRLAGEPDPVLAANLTLAGRVPPALRPGRAASRTLLLDGCRGPGAAADVGGSRSVIRSPCCRRCSTCCGRGAWAATWTGRWRITRWSGGTDG